MVMTISARSAMPLGSSKNAMSYNAAKHKAQRKLDGEGNLLNPIRLDNFKPTDEESIGKQLQKIAKEKDTKGEYRRVGEIHGFTILMCSEPLDKDGLGMFQNKFCVEGRSASPLGSSKNFKYKYNNGFIALSDPIAAARNFNRIKVFFIKSIKLSNCFNLQRYKKYSKKALLPP